MARAKRTFTWEGIDQSGKKTSGKITSTSINLTRIQLGRQGIQPTRVTGLGGLPGYASLSSWGGKITSADIALFTRQVATMIKAGVPLVQSFEIVAAGTENQKMQRVIQGLKDDVASGHSLTHALRAQPKYFDELFCCLINAGEQAGTLDILLGQIAQYREMAEALKAKFKSALSYPATVLVVAGLVSAILLVKVVPQFEEIFAGFGAELPELTQAVVKLSGAYASLVAGNARRHRRRLVPRQSHLSRLQNHATGAGTARVKATGIRQTAAQILSCQICPYARHHHCGRGAPGGCPPVCRGGHRQHCLLPGGGPDG